MVGYNPLAYRLLLTFLFTLLPRLRLRCWLVVGGYTYGLVLAGYGIALLWTLDNCQIWLVTVAIVPRLPAFPGLPFAARGRWTRCLYYRGLLPLPVRHATIQRALAAGADITRGWRC